MGVLRTFEQSCKSAADASQKQLLSILKDNAAMIFTHTRYLQRLLSIFSMLS